MVDDCSHLYNLTHAQRDALGAKERVVLVVTKPGKYASHNGGFLEPGVYGYRTADDKYARLADAVPT